MYRDINAEFVCGKLCEVRKREATRVFRRRAMLWRRNSAKDASQKGWSFTDYVHKANINKCFLGGIMLFLDWPIDLSTALCNVYNGVWWEDKIPPDIIPPILVSHDCPGQNPIEGGQKPTRISHRTYLFYIAFYVYIYESSLLPACIFMLWIIKLDTYSPMPLSMYNRCKPRM